jgi:hypothetical protein
MALRKIQTRTAGVVGLCSISILGFITDDNAIEAAYYADIKRPNAIGTSQDAVIA